MEYRKVKDLKELPGNPRLITDEQLNALCKSIQDNKEYFEARPIIISDRTGEFIILACNQRYKAAKKLGIKEVPTHLLSGLTEEKEREISLRDNISNGEWDWQAIQSDWPEAEEWGLDIPDKFKVMPEAGEDDYEIPDEVETDIVMGDLFEIGEHRLLCGSSTDGEQVLKLMGEKKADMMFTDPPYNVDYEGKTKEKLKIQNDDIKDFTGFLTDAFLSADAVLNPGAVYYIAHPDIFAYEFITAVRSCNWKQARPPVVQWVKDSLVMGRGDYHAQSEPILYGWKDGAAHLKVLTRTESNVWNIPRPKSSQEHPTMKPVELVARAIKNHSVGIILDLFLGSGTTMVAAHQLNRKCYGMELDPKYCQVIIDRMRKLNPNITIKKNGVAL